MHEHTFPVVHSPVIEHYLPRGACYNLHRWGLNEIQPLWLASYHCSFRHGIFGIGTDELGVSHTEYFIAQRQTWDTRTNNLDNA